MLEESKTHAAPAQIPAEGIRSCAGGRVPAANRNEALQARACGTAREAESRGLAMSPDQGVGCRYLDPVGGRKGRRATYRVVQVTVGKLILQRTND